ncbi:MAG: filamentous hemagglutinin N-terminal domain-containing protein [Pseudomonadota bacterium]
MTQTRISCSIRIFRRCWVWAALPFFLAVPSQAAVVLDGSLGARGPLAGPHYQVDPALGRQQGANLFHSFERLGLSAAESLTFLGPASVQRVISRVTGGELSSIDGTLGLAIPGADLYLINPAGVMFGPNARLDVKGSFFLSTADRLRFADGSHLESRLGGISTFSSFSSAPPVAFGFLAAASPGRLRIEVASLSVPAGFTLGLAGGAVTLTDARLVVPGGQILLAAASDGEVRIEPNGLRLMGIGAPIEILGGSHGPPVAALDVSGPAGGRLGLESGSLHIQQALLLAQTQGAGQGGGVAIAIQGEAILENHTHVDTSTSGSGNAGAVRITAHDLTLRDGAQVISETQGSGRGGDIEAQVTGQLLLKGSPGTGTDNRSGLYANNLAAGSGGAGIIRVEAGALTLDRGDLQSATEGTGQAGRVEATADNIVLINSGQILSFTRGQGAGGDISVTARQGLFLSGFAREGQDLFKSGLFTYSGDSDFLNAGQAGTIRVQAPRLEIMGGANILSSTSGNGDAGNIHLRVGDMWVDNSLLSSSNRTQQGNGRSGDIEINADQLLLTHNAFIVAQNRSRPLNLDMHPGGNIAIHVQGSLRVDQGSVVSAQSSFNPGGNIEILAASTQLLNGGHLDAESSGTDPHSRGGNVRVQGDNLVINGGTSRIGAHADLGKGGNILVDTRVFLHDGRPVIGNILNASSRVSGNDGNVAVNAPQLDISGQLVALPQRYLDAAGLLNKPCGLEDQSKRSRLAVMGRGGLGLPPCNP